MSPIPMWTDRVEAFSSIGGILVALCGFLLLFRQLRQMDYQLTQVKRSLRGDTHAALYSQGVEVMLYLSEHANLRPFFYDCKPTPADGELRGSLLIAAEIVADFHEHVALQLDALPAEVRQRWITYICTTHQRSPILREFVTTNRPWYSDSLHSLVEANVIQPNNE